ncbi:undecaprenyldiphospho-muramoylpentapeptide beta-N-acetylglucosaminyltransferase [Acetobacteraceae bacterium H6797]|nr:undecaprenyldiphospho-muramoylpentapeptide beta-N-acetylglucosaminyltransferase [Acetobacteraceae bacterium H6797]
MSRPIVIAAGGTGGHLFPAEALAAELIARGERVALMTDARSSAFASAAFAGAERFILKGSGLAGHGALKAAKGAIALAVGTIEARGLLKRLDAAAVVGFGGYPSVPPVLAARLLSARPVVVLHEQNAVLGRANKLMARFADALALSFAGTTRVPSTADSVLVGNPVRPALAALASQPYAAPEPGGAIRLLVTGGSLGARVLSDVVPAAIAQLAPELRSRLLITQQARAEDIDRVRAAYAPTGVPVELAPFFGDIATRLSTAHLVIARAGASTIAELACAGRPSLLVPLPNAIDDHQSANARALVTAGAAQLMPQARFTPESLAAALVEWLTTAGKLTRAAEAAAGLAQPDAARSLADLTLQRIAARAGMRTETR